MAIRHHVAITFHLPVNSLPYIERCFHTSNLQTDAASPLATSAATGSGEKFSSSSTSGASLVWQMWQWLTTNRNTLKPSETGEADGSWLMLANAG